MNPKSNAEIETPVCESCKKPPPAGSPPLKHCAKCKTNRYCWRECQKADWKPHKKVCGRSNNDAGPSDSSLNGFTLPNANTATTESWRPCSKTSPWAHRRQISVASSPAAPNQVISPGCRSKPHSLP